MKDKTKLLALKDRTYLGIELGSTRIKSVLINSEFEVLATGSYEWENKLEDGYWTYALDEIWRGLQQSYQSLAEAVQERYGTVLTEVQGIGFSAMMHGYMAFDQSGELLVPFRTWRNATTSQAAKELSEAFQFNIPERWSIAQLYQAVLDHEQHLSEIDYFTTLAGYVHWKLTGKKVIGIGDASGMFPIDSLTKNYNKRLIKKFNTLTDEKNVDLDLNHLLPSVLQAGEMAGKLTEQGARLLDPTGNLKAGIPLCPPEGDAGTGMVATNSIEVKTGNISVGTSAFAMVILEKELKKVYPEIDLVTTPNGHPVAMVHANNCSSDINAWIKLFEEYTNLLGIKVEREKIYSILFNKALEAGKEMGGLMSYGYLPGENITQVSEGRPLFVRQPESEFTLANFMSVHLSSAFAAIRVGMDILHQEGIEIKALVGHGGLFKTPKVGQSILAAAMQAPVTVMETAGEGGAWGMAILSAFQGDEEEDLNQFLKSKVFSQTKGITIHPTKAAIESYDIFIKRYLAGINIERQAIHSLKKEI